MSACGALEPRAARCLTPEPSFRLRGAAVRLGRACGARRAEQEEHGREEEVGVDEGDDHQGAEEHPEAREEHDDGAEEGGARVE